MDRHYIIEMSLPYNPPPDAIQSEYLSQVTPTSDVARKMKEVQQYRQNIGENPYSSYSNLDEDTMFTNIHPKQMQLRPPVKEMPSYLDSGKTNENPLMSVEEFIATCRSVVEHFAIR